MQNKVRQLELINNLPRRARHTANHRNGGAVAAVARVGVATVASSIASSVVGGR